MKLSTTYPVTSHTRYVRPGSIFVAIKGFKLDGTAYIPDALERGATRIVIKKGTSLDESVLAMLTKKNAELVFVDSPRRALAELAAEAHGYPARQLKLIGITGTKGKTTTAYLLEHVLRSAGHKTALLGTVKNRILDREYETELTTPQPDYLHAFFKECVDQGVEYVVMEAAAQALSVHRLATLSFDSVIFTNFSLEHSEFYDSLDEYFKAKCQLFSLVDKKGLVVLNADDERVAGCIPDWPQRVTISMQGDATYQGDLKESTLSSFSLSVTTSDEQYVLSSSSLLGEFSAYNLLASSAVANRYGIDKDTLQNALDTFKGVPGRLNLYTLPNNAVAVIDNAHTPSSFKALLSSVRPLSDHIIAIFGAGGDRDALKRPLMGQIATELADQVIVTTDNPRSEDAGAIADQIVAGVPQDLLNKVSIDLDREQAIKAAYAKTRKGSLLLLLGKGPVEYQHIQDKKIPFSEAALLRTLRS